MHQMHRTRYPPHLQANRVSGVGELNESYLAASIVTTLAVGVRIIEFFEYMETYSYIKLHISDGDSK